MISSMGDVYSISSGGATTWHFQLPNDDVTSKTASIPLTDAMYPDKSSTELSMGDADEEDVPTLEVSITILGMEPTVSHLKATSESVFVGSSDGRLLILSTTGQLRTVHSLTGSWARPVMDTDDTSVAAYSRDALFRWERDRLRHITDVADIPDGVGVWSDGVYMWNRKSLDVLNWTGQVIWSIEFSKNISSVVVQGRRLVCAAGVLTAFARPHGAI